MEQYRLGDSYRDSGSSSDPDDQFLRWINIPGSGIRNMGGIRPLKFTSLRLPVHAYIILVTHERSTGSASNPWEDLVDLPHGRIVYWGDAKHDPRRTLNDFIGNRSLAASFDQVLEDRRALIPPILHFSKPRAGVATFNGLCVLDRLELTWFEDHRHPVRNYRVHLTVLDQEFVDLDWLHRRATATTVEQLHDDGPEAWRRYQAGFVDRLQIWAPQIRDRESQLPALGSPDARVLEQLAARSPIQFEAAVVGLFRELDEVRHNITRTRPTQDGGFDFFGSFTFPPPLRYEIPFLGEAKKFSMTSAVSPRHVSRLVARLNRGQYGIFVTTSYFTKQSQEEVLADAYPTPLIAGADVVRMMRELRIARGGEISPSWLRAVEDETLRPLRT
jgi:Restriction endonuclease AspBHI N-terminal/Restriction endonuclease